MTNNPQDLPLTAKELAMVAATAQRVKHFNLTLDPKEVLRMSREFKKGDCFIKHKFSEDDYEHNLKVILLNPVDKDSNEYMVVAEDYGMTH